MLFRSFQTRHKHTVKLQPLGGVNRHQLKCILAGAGLSTAAGIPDFRGPEGLWTRDPYAELVSTLSWYLRDDDVRKAAWRRRADPAMWAAQPTRAHRAIVELLRQRARRTTGSSGSFCQLCCTGWFSA